MDVTTLIGLIGGIGVFLWSVLSSSDIGIFINIPSLIMVIGGSIASVITSFPLHRLLRLFGVCKKAVLWKQRDPRSLISDLVGYAEIARRDGILSLENITRNLDDDFLKGGIQMAVDGTDPQMIEQIMMGELEAMQERHEQGKALLDGFKTYGPAFGMIGTLVGLVIMLKNMNDASRIGPGMAVAILTTLYGAIMMNIIFGPLGDKLAVRSSEEMFLKMIVVKGVMSIQSGDNPRIVEQKLKTFLPVSMRRGGTPKA
jgi:chemotaxis protein MotA